VISASNCTKKAGSSRIVLILTPNFPAKDVVILSKGTQDVDNDCFLVLVKILDHEVQLVLFPFSAIRFFLSLYLFLPSHLAAVKLDVGRRYEGGSSKESLN
jgi:hypothetical protein